MSKRFIPTSVPEDIRLDATDITARGVLRHPRGGVVSRLGGMVTLYFTQSEKAEVRRALLSILDDYLALFGDGIGKFQARDDRRLRDWRGGGIPAPYLDAAVIENPDELFYVFMSSRQDGGSDPCPLLFMAFGHDAASADRNRPLGGLKLHLPAEFLLDQPDEAVRRIADWAGRLPLAHGSGGLAALSQPGLEDQDPYWWPWLRAYPALDYDAMGSYWSELRDNPDQFWRPRVSNWLTLLGPLAQKELALEDASALAAAAGPAVEAVPAGQAVLLRAGTRPALGSAATGGIPEAYGQVARLIRPVRFEAYTYSVISFPPAIAPDSAARKALMLDWLRRLD